MARGMPILPEEVLNQLADNKSAKQQIVNEIKEKLQRARHCAG